MSARLDLNGDWIQVQIGPWTHEIPLAEFKRLQTPHEGTREAVAQVAAKLAELPLDTQADVDAANAELVRIEAVKEVR